MTAEQEYAVCSESARHYETIFFAHLTVFIAVNGGLATVLTATPQSPHWLLIIAKRVGCLIAAVFWVNAEIYLYRYHHFLEGRVCQVVGSCLSSG